VFSPSSFFSLETFAHKELFAQERFVWLILKSLEAYVLQLASGFFEELDGVYIENPETVSIGPGTIIEPGAFIRGPCVLGRNCLVRHGAYLRGNVLVGDSCVIGHATEIKHSVLLDGARAAHFAFVGDSILGNDVNLGAGVKCANLRLDGEPVQVRREKETISTGLRKLGAVLGDGCHIGCNTVLNPGTILGRGAQCCPNMTVGGVVGEKVFLRKTETQRRERE